MNDLFYFMKNYQLRFASTVPEHLLCSACRKVLIDSYFFQCGCKFCANCISVYLDNKCEPCPGCTDKNSMSSLSSTKATKDAASDAQISNLEVFCPNESCEVKYSIRKMVSHVRTCIVQPVECPFYSVGCNEMITGPDTLASHSVVANMDHLKLLLTFLKNMDNEMRQQMNAFQQQLHDMQGENERRMSEWQVQKDEFRRTIDNTNALCSKVQEKQRTVEQPTTSGMQPMARRTDETLKEIERKLLSVESDLGIKLQETRDSFNSQIEILRKEMEEKIKMTANELNGESRKQNEQLAKQMQSTIEQRLWQMDQTLDISFKRQVSYVQEGCHQQIKELKNNLKRLTDAQDALRNNEFLWKVENVWERRRSMIKTYKPLKSDYFYSHHNGYKCCLFLSNSEKNLDGRWFLSLSFTICKGPYDDLLTWPMNKCVRLSIINQQTGTDYISVDCSYSDANERNEKAFQKPINDHCEPYKFMENIRLDELQKENGVIIRNSLFIRCTFIDCYGLSIHSLNSIVTQDLR